MSYRIPACNFPALEEKIAKLNRKAAKLGCAPIILNVIGTVKVEEKNQLTGLVFERTYFEVEVSGEAPSLEGWHFLGVVEQVASGENLIRSIPGVELPESYRTASMTCEHCNTNRRRKSVFVLRNDDGRMVKVGKNCLRDFLGHVDPESLVSQAEWLMELDDTLRESCGGRGVLCFDIREFLGLVAVCIRRLGWVSRANASFENRSTASLAWDILSMSGNEEVNKFIETNRLVAENRDMELAEAALEWAGKQGGKVCSEYLHNLGLACRLSYVNSKTMGLVASAIASFQHTMVKQEEVKKVAAEKKHIGTVGERLEIEVTVKRLRYFDRAWGVKTLALFEDEDGNNIIWWASRSLDIEEGDVVSLKGTVVEHSEYNGLPQTTMKRCKIKVLQC